RVLVDVYSAGLSYFDIFQAQGKYQHQPTQPFVPGSELTGRIAESSPIPDGCPFSAAQGAFAVRTARRTCRATAAPVQRGVARRAGLFATWTTSYEGVRRGREHRGLSAAREGAILVLWALGAKVVAAAGSQEKLDISVKYGGTDHSVNYSKEGWREEVLKLTGGQGVDVTYDPIGLIRDSPKYIALNGHAIVVGFAAGQVDKLALNLVLLKNISIASIHWGVYTRGAGVRLPRVLCSCFSLFHWLVASGRAKPVVYSETYPLDRLADGLSALEQRKTWGKVIVHVRDASPTGPKANPQAPSGRLSCAVSI
ncbi:alcohol dehydrogenase, partial [Epithele typhae]|uniref:alcohol dehydrogenase n=1 Tax=Epithele typhae TaxID=378194 RepID=UPI002008BB96